MSCILECTETIQWTPGLTLGALWRMWYHGKKGNVFQERRISQADKDREVTLKFDIISHCCKIIALLL